jgi:hypothetical protein
MGFGAANIARRGGTQSGAQIDEQSLNAAEPQQFSVR